MFPAGAVVLGVLWVTAGTDAFLPFVTNIYMQNPGPALGSAMAASAPQTVCSWYNIPGYLNTVAQQNSGNPAGNGWGSSWLNGRGNAGTSGGGNAGLSSTLPGLMAILNGVYPSSVTGSSGQVGRPGVVVRTSSVTGTDPRGSGASAASAPTSGNAGGTRELDYYDQSAPYYYGDDDYYYGQSYTDSDSDDNVDNVVYYDTLPQTEAPPPIVGLLQSLYGSPFGTGYTGGSNVASNACVACQASLLNMLMG